MIVFIVLLWFTSLAGFGRPAIADDAPRGITRGVDSRAAGNWPLATPEEKADLDGWIHEHLSGDTVTPPFSFRYDGRSSSPLIQSWRLERTRKYLDTERIQWMLRHADPNSGLIVTCQAIQYTDYPAVEWVLFFENDSIHNTPILEDVQAADLTFASARPGRFTLYHAEGSSAKRTDFRPLQTSLTARTDLGCFGGRSSDGALPLFNLKFPDQRGMVLAVGWTGQWAASFEPAGNSAVGFRAGETDRMRLWRDLCEFSFPALCTTSSRVGMEGQAT